MSETQRGRAPTPREAGVIAKRRAVLLTRFRTRWNTWHSAEGCDPDIPALVRLAVSRWLLMQAKAAVADDGRHLLTESIWTHLLAQSEPAPHYLYQNIADAEWKRASAGMHTRYHDLDKSDWTFEISEVMVGKFALPPRLLWRLIG